VVLASFGREELGRARILFTLAEEVETKGAALNAVNINRACGDHITKQKWGQVSITQYADANSALGKLHRKILDNPAGSEEYKRAHAELERLTKIQEKRGPEQRHKERMNALYVEISNIGWNRPKEIKKEEAEKFVEAATNDYRKCNVAIQNPN